MSLVETPWGISRMDRAGVWRLNPKTLRLEGFFGGGMAGANCWGVAFDDFGQVFHKTGDRPEGYWTVPGMVRGADPLGSGDRHIASQSYGASLCSGTLWGRRRARNTRAGEGSARA